MENVYLKSSIVTDIWLCIGWNALRTRYDDPDAV